MPSSNFDRYLHFYNLNSSQDIEHYHYFRRIHPVPPHMHSPIGTKSNFFPTIGYFCMFHKFEYMESLSIRFCIKLLSLDIVRRQLLSLSLRLLLVLWVRHWLISSTLSFQWSLYSKQPWNTEIVFPSRVKVKHAYSYLSVFSIYFAMSFNVKFFILMKFDYDYCFPCPHKPLPTHKSQEYPSIFSSESLKILVFWLDLWPCQIMFLE